MVQCATDLIAPYITLCTLKENMVGYNQHQIAFPAVCYDSTRERSFDLSTKTTGDSFTVAQVRMTEYLNFSLEGLLGIDEFYNIEPSPRPRPGVTITSRREAFTQHFASASVNPSFCPLLKLPRGKESSYMLNFTWGSQSSYAFGRNFGTDVSATVFRNTCSGQVIGSQLRYVHTVTGSLTGVAIRWLQDQYRNDPEEYIRILSREEDILRKGQSRVEYSTVRLYEAPDETLDFEWIVWRCARIRDQLFWQVDNAMPDVVNKLKCDCLNQCDILDMNNVENLAQLQSDFKDFQQSYRDIKKNGIKAIDKYQDSLRKIKKSNPFFRRTKVGKFLLISGLALKQGASSWLSKKYTIDTTVSDIKQVYEQFPALRETIGGVGYRRFLQRPSASSTDTTVFGLRVRTRVELYCLPKVLDTWHRGLRQIENLGLTIRFQNLWDLVPFSFVVDWFADLGTFFNELDESLGLITHDFIVEGATVSRKFDYVSDEFPSLTFSIYVRQVEDTFRLEPTYQPGSGLTGDRGITGAALVISNAVR